MKPNIEFIRARAELLRQVRSFFDQRKFLEVQPPCLSRDCIVDPYINPLSVSAKEIAIGSGELPDRFYLQTSPELAMKRMIAAGAPSIYSIGPVFRAGERGSQHNIEFTMLEWYDVGAKMEGGIELLGRLICEVTEQPRFEVTTYRAVFIQRFGWDPIQAPLATIASEASILDEELVARLGDDRDGLLDLLFSYEVQPRLGDQIPVVVKNYPISQAALAREANDDATCAARFEMFFRGIELANGYDELLDADILIERSRFNNERRTNCGQPEIPIDTTLVESMRQGLPPCTGVALGFDRLLMVKTQVDSIEKVIPFPIEIA